MDRKRATINIMVGMFFKIIVLLLSIVSKSFVVRILGDEVNGLYSLYVSIIGFLSIANLGIGSVITFSMYRPIVEKDDDTISALYFLYRKFYIIVMFIILIIGSILIPFIPSFAKDNSGNVNVYLTYFIFLVSVCITYLYAHKTSLINAYKDNYITTFISSSSLIIEGLVQIIVLVYTKNFVYFLLVRVLSSSINGFLTSLVFRKKYSKKINGNKDVSDEIKNELLVNSKASIISEVGANLTSTFDGIIISAIVGVIALGLYSNYIVIVSGVTSILGLLFSEITSIIGQKYVNDDKERFQANFNKIYVFNFIVGLIMYTGFIAIGSNLVSIIFGDSKVESNSLVLLIGVNYFTQFQRRTVGLFSSSSGRFVENRYRPLIEGVLNIIISVILVINFGVIGVMIGTVVSRLLITYTMEPKILFNNTFEKSSKKFIIIHFSTVVVFILTSIIITRINIYGKFNIYIDTLLRGVTSVIVSLLVLIIITIFSKEFRYYIKNVFSDFKKIIRIK